MRLSKDGIVFGICLNNKKFFIVIPYTNNIIYAYIKSPSADVSTSVVITESNTFFGCTKN